MAAEWSCELLGFPPLWENLSELEGTSEHAEVKVWSGGTEVPSGEG